MKATIEYEGSVIKLEGDADEVVDLLHKIGLLDKDLTQEGAPVSTDQPPSDLSEVFSAGNNSEKMTNPSTPLWMEGQKYTPVSELTDEHLLYAIAHCHRSFSESLKSVAKSYVNTNQSCGALYLKAFLHVLRKGIEGNVKQRLPKASFIGLIQELEKRASRAEANGKTTDVAAASLADEDDYSYYE